MGRPKLPTDRIWERIAVHPLGCWEWQGAINSHGYGYVNYNGRNMRVHRAAYIETWGSIPDGLQICHLCNNRRCINPAHLYAGTVADNAQDRSIHSGRVHVFARALRDVREGTLITHASRRHGVDINTLRALVQGRHWSQTREG